MRKHKHQQMKGIEVRFRRAQEAMRSMRVTPETKELQKDLAWMMREIEEYGFAFFPNHYVGDQVIQFEAMVKQLEEHPSTKAKR